MTESLLQPISDKMGNHQFANVQCTCIECHKPFKLRLERTGSTGMYISGGAIGVNTKASGDNRFHFKCQECLDIEEETGIKNWGLDCEVYSRVVGYLRPVSNWNSAKQEEFGRRRTYEEPCQERITAKESTYLKSAV